MPSDPFSGFSSAFDELLKKDNGALGGDPGDSDPALRPAQHGAEGNPMASGEASATLVRPSSSHSDRIGHAFLKNEGEYLSAVQVWEPGKSEAAQRLIGHLGEKWRFTVAKRHREGDEFVVMGRLELLESGAVKTQFGRGVVPRTNRGSGSAGSAAGVSFQIGTEPDSGGQTPEERGYRRAIEDALSKCAALV